MSETIAPAILGHTTCHLCSYPHVPVKVMKTLRAYYTCPECDVQVFTRSRAGDKLLRDKTRPTTTTQPAPPKAPTNETKTPAAKPAPGKPAVAAVAGSAKPDPFAF